MDFFSKNTKTLLLGTLLGEYKMTSRREISASKFLLEKIHPEIVLLSIKYRKRYK